MNKINKKTYILLACLLLAAYCFYSITSLDKKDLGGGYTYYYEQDHVLGRDKTQPDIPPTIDAFSYDDEFIIAKQSLRGRCPSAMYNAPDNYVDYPLGLDSTYYWIIVKKNDSLLGPLTKSEFNEKYREMKIELPLFSDVTNRMQYKRIGKTDFYIAQMQGPNSIPCLGYKAESVFISIAEYLKDVRWNKDYLLVRCYNQYTTDSISQYYIIDYHQKHTDTVEPFTMTDYPDKEAFDSATVALGINSSEMKYTNNNI